MRKKKMGESTQYDNTNRGAVFKAKERKTDRSPHRTGELTVQCPKCNIVSEFWLSGWLKKAKTTGQQFLSLAINPKDPPDNPGYDPDDGLADEDIPF